MKIGNDFERALRSRMPLTTYRGPRWKNFNPLSDAPVPMPFGPGTVGGTGSTSLAFIFAQLTPPNLVVPAPACILNLQGGGPTNYGRMEGRKFTVRASGNLFVHGTSPTVNIVLQSGTSLTSTSNTTIATIGSNASLTTATNYPWAIEATLQGTTPSGIIQGVFNVMINNVFTAGAALTNKLTGIDFTKSPFLQLVIGVVFGVSDALNVATLNEFAYGF